MIKASQKPRRVTRFEKWLLQDLGGERTEKKRLDALIRAQRPKAKDALRARRVVRLESTARRNAKIIVVDVTSKPSEQEVRKKLRVRGPLNIFYIVREKHWAALGPQEYNPDDPDAGESHRRFLYNLMPYCYVWTPRGEIPGWMRKGIEVKEWPMP